MTLGNRLKLVVVSSAVWIVLSLEGGEGTNIGGDETRFRRRRDNHDSYQADSNEDDITTYCNCTSQSSRLTCKTPNPGCEPGEVQLDDSCYRFFTEGKSRDESVLDCIQRNSHLVYIETEQEQRSLVSYLSDNTSLNQDDYWLGLVAVDVTYSWMNGNTEAQEFFMVDESSRGNCVTLTRRAGNVNVKTDVCNNDNNFICEIDLPSTGCDREYGNSCYKVFGFWKTREEASDWCFGWGGHLLYIETREEINYINQNLLNSNKDYWIGLDVMRTYEWMDATRAMFQTFQSSNGDNGNECFRMRRNNFKWNDQSCTRNFGHICERRTYGTEIPFGAYWCQSSIPNDLIHLSKYGSLCIDDSSSTPVLRSCGTPDVVEGCSCYRETANYGPIQCACGYCNLSFTRNGRMWPSAFNCTCSSGLEEEPFTITKDTNNTEFTCSSERLTSTALNVISQVATHMPSTSTGTAETNPNEFVSSFSTSTRPVSSSTAGERGTAASVISNGGAIAAGVILAVVFFVGLLMVAFFVWRRKGRKRSEKKSERSDKSRAAKNLYASGQPETVNPTYSLNELDISKQSDEILKPVHGVGVHAAHNPTYEIGGKGETSSEYTYIKSPEDNKEYADIQPRGYETLCPKKHPDPYTALKGSKGENESGDPATYTQIPDKAGETYATIASGGYTAYNPTKQDEDVNTDPLSTRDTDGDDPLDYTPIPNNDRGKPAKKVVDDVGNGYLGLGDVVPHCHAAAAAKTTRSTPGRSGDSDYVDVDVKVPQVLKPTVSPKKKKSEYVNVDVSTTRDGSYVSMDAPTSHENQGDDPSTAENDYYFKLEKPQATPDEGDEASNSPQEDHTYNSLAVNARKVPGQGKADVLDNSAYNTVDRTHKIDAAPKSSGQSPAQGNKDDNAYDAINRIGGGLKYPIVAADDGDYSLTVPVRDDTYNSFDRSHGRNKNPRSSNQASQNDYGSLANSNDDEYATFN